MFAQITDENAGGVFLGRGVVSCSRSAFGCRSWLSVVDIVRPGASRGSWSESDDHSATSSARRLMLLASQWRPPPTFDEAPAPPPSSAPALAWTRTRRRETTASSWTRCAAVPWPQLLAPRHRLSPDAGSEYAPTPDTCYCPHVVTDNG